MTTKKISAEQMITELKIGMESTGAGTLHYQKMQMVYDALREIKSEPVMTAVVYRSPDSVPRIDFIGARDFILSSPDNVPIQLFTAPPGLVPQAGEGQTRLSCGCWSHYSGFPCEWLSVSRKGEPATSYGVLCEQHYSEYDAKPALPQPVIPSGWKLVPVEPTLKMIKPALEHITNGRIPDLDVAEDAEEDFHETCGRVMAIYQAMLDAAPQPAGFSNAQIEAAAKALFECDSCVYYQYSQNREQDWNEAKEAIYRNVKTILEAAIKAGMNK